MKIEIFSVNSNYGNGKLKNHYIEKLKKYKIKETKYEKYGSTRYSYYIELNDLKDIFNLVKDRNDILKILKGEGNESNRFIKQNSKWGRSTRENNIQRYSKKI